MSVNLLVFREWENAFRLCTHFRISWEVRRLDHLDRWIVWLKDGIDFLLLARGLRERNKSELKGLFGASLLEPLLIFPALKLGTEVLHVGWLVESRLVASHLDWSEELLLSLLHIIFLHHSRVLLLAQDIVLGDGLVFLFVQEVHEVFFNLDWRLLGFCLHVVELWVVYLLEVVAERAPKPVGDIHSVITQDEIENIGAKYRKITGYDRETLNSRGSLVP